MTYHHKEEYYVCIECGAIQSSHDADKTLPCEKCGGNTFQRKQKMFSGE